MRLWISVLTISLFAEGLLTEGRRSKRATSPQCTDRFKLFDRHTMCLPNSKAPPTPAEGLQIAYKHNQKRSFLTPRASNMATLQWSRSLALMAQKWAEKCEMKHEKSIQRYYPGRFQVGQNIASQPNVAMTWSTVIDLWFNESNSFTYGGPNIFGQVGHYTQLVWAETTAVGCGWAKCDSTYYYVCDYAPAGNRDGQINKPYKSGTACADCGGQSSPHCNKNYTVPLCDCKGLLCLNGGTRDLQTCSCSCNTDVKTYGGAYCELNCTDGQDNSLCGTAPWDAGSCRTNPSAMENCPNMCHICPYAGLDYHEGSVPLPSNGAGYLGNAFTTVLPLAVLTTLMATSAMHIP